ncbi:hypothetical protein K2W90_00135 [Candidatus Babeliales bacterium]|nr:hypothetical protein [Candidatus Babeliales bacterium]
MKKHLLFAGLLLLQTSCFAANPAPTFDTAQVTAALQNLSTAELAQLVEQAQIMLHDQDSLATLAKNLEQKHNAAMSLKVVALLATTTILVVLNLAQLALGVLTPPVCARNTDGKFWCNMTIKETGETINLLDIGNGWTQYYFGDEPTEYKVNALQAANVFMNGLFGNCGKN